MTGPSLPWLTEIGDSNAAAAAIYAAHGWPVFACDGKRPATAHGFTDAAPDASPWERAPSSNIGWAIPTGWWALDVDPRHGGVASLRALERERGPLPMTLRQTTGSGGEHWIFADGGRPLRQLTGFRPGLDTRVGGKGYLIVAPSVHPATGRRYEWLAVVAPVEAPAWLLDLVCEPAKAERPIYVPPAKVDRRELTRRQRYARAVLDGLARDVASACEGTRNATLNRAWFRSGQFADVITKTDARTALTVAALAAGLDEKEIRRVLR